MKMNETKTMNTNNVSETMNLTNECLSPGFPCLLLISLNHWSSILPFSPSSSSSAAFSPSLSPPPIAAGALRQPTKTHMGHGIMSEKYFGTYT